jgi:iron complex transport system ATP-binding protein
MADGMALLLSTHHPDHALSLADRAVLLGRGGARTGPAEELLTDPALTALYGVPVRTLPYSDDGATRRTIVVPFGEARDREVRERPGG